MNLINKYAKLKFGLLKEKIKNIISICKNNEPVVSVVATVMSAIATVISAITAVFLVVVACISLYQTYEITQQQKEEEFHRLRAYVYGVDINSINGSKDAVKDLIKLTLKNSGQTPAFDLRATMKIDDHVLNSENIELNIYPQNSIHLNFLFEKNLLAKGKHRLTFEYHYRTYNNICFSLQMIGTSSPAESMTEFRFGSPIDHEIKL